jgi:hypothetical protein
VLPTYHTFCRVILLLLVIALKLFVHVRVNSVLRYSRLLIFMSVKVMLTVFRHRGCCALWILTSGANSESLVYSRSTEMSKGKCQEKKTSVVEKNSWFLHHDNTPAHASLLIRDFSLGNNKKSTRARSGEYGDWGSTIVFMLAKRLRIKELPTNSKNKNIRDLYRGINDFKRGY